MIGYSSTPTGLLAFKENQMRLLIGLLILFFSFSPIAFANNEQYCLTIMMEAFDECKGVCTTQQCINNCYGKANLAFQQCMESHPGATKK